MYFDKKGNLKTKKTADLIKFFRLSLTLFLFDVRFDKVDLKIIVKEEKRTKDDNAFS